MDEDAMASLTFSSVKTRVPWSTEASTAASSTRLLEPEEAPPSHGSGEGVNQAILAGLLSLIVILILIIFLLVLLLIWRGKRQAGPVSSSSDQQNHATSSADKTNTASRKHQCRHQTKDEVTVVTSHHPELRDTTPRYVIIGAGRNQENHSNSVLQTNKRKPDCLETRKGLKAPERLQDQTIVASSSPNKNVELDSPSSDVASYEEYDIQCNTPNEAGVRISHYYQNISSLQPCTSTELIANESHTDECFQNVETTGNRTKPTEFSNMARSDDSQEAIYENPDTLVNPIPKASDHPSGIALMQTSQGKVKSYGLKRVKQPDEEATLKQWRNNSRLNKSQDPFYENSQ